MSATQTFQFLETTTTQDMKRDNKSGLSTAQLRIHLLQRLGKHCEPQELLLQFHTTAIKSTLTSPIAVWFGIDHKIGMKQTASGL